MMLIPVIEPSVERPTMLEAKTPGGGAGAQGGHIEPCLTLLMERGSCASNNSAVRWRVVASGEGEVSPSKCCSDVVTSARLASEVIGTIV